MHIVTDMGKQDGLSRRDFVRSAARTLLGVGTLSLGWDATFGYAKETEAPSVLPGFGRAKRVIYLFMTGGMTHLDTFDPKPGAETQGPVEALKTSADDVRVTQYFPKMAQQMHHACVVNSMSSTQGAHAQGRYFMHTSYTLRATIQHPHMGAWLHRLQGKHSPDLPASVLISGNSAGGLGNGFLESRFASLPIGDPKAGLQNSKLARGVSQDRFDERMKRSHAKNQAFLDRYNTRAVRAYTDMYRDAVRLMKSKELDAFDISKESEAQQAAYGDNPFGQGCLLARRLVEQGVRYVEVNSGGWDTHNDNFGRLEEKGPVLDQALAALIADLHQRGLLDETLVVLATEFGRTPDIVKERNNGRNHYPKAFTCLLAGGGVKGGFRYGKTDAEGREVVENKVAVPDFNATIAHALGLQLNKKIVSPSGRPFTVADDGKPVLELFV